jgi:F-type H+-transporting ATPase subunit c
MHRKMLAFLITFCMIALTSATAFAQGAMAPADNYFSMYGMLAIAAGFGIGLAAIGGAYGQGKAAAAALEGIARNPGAAGKLNTPLILSLALIESLVIYAFVITIMIATKIDLAVIPK